VRALASEGRTRDAGLRYALGRIAIVAPSASPLVPDAALDGLRSALDQGRITRFAIANPEHAPYGVAARQALMHAGLWQALQPKLVLGENVAQAAQFALSGSAEGGIIPYSLVVAPPLAGRLRFALIPESWHAPLEQRMVLLDHAGRIAEAFYRYLQMPVARAILVRYGYSAPDP
jgi:molybdate transport system substrate-binding protein